jgi:hypothetical protein
VYFDAGRILHAAGHDELVQRDGAFAHLYRAQLASQAAQPADGGARDVIEPAEERR